LLATEGLFVSGYQQTLNSS